MKLVIASDHAGFPLKEKIAEYLSKEKINCQDFGVNTLESVDYSDYATQVAEAVSNGKADAGILVCGTGLGMSISANKFKGVRAVTVSDLYSARMAKEHNNANVLALGGRVLDPAKALRLVQVWLKSSFQERHQKRLDKISELEKKNLK